MTHLPRPPPQAYCKEIPAAEAAELVDVMPILFFQ